MAVDDQDRVTVNLFPTNNPGAPKTSPFDRKTQLQNAAKNDSKRKKASGLVRKPFWIKKSTDTAISLVKEIQGYDSKGDSINEITAFYLKAMSLDESLSDDARKRVFELLNDD